MQLSLPMPCAFSVTLFFLMRLFKVAAGKPMWATVQSSRATLERPAEIFSSIFFPALLVEEDPRCPFGHYFRHERAPGQNHRPSVSQLDGFFTWKIPTRVRIEPTAVRDLWSQVSDLNHTATEAPSDIKIYVKLYICTWSCKCVCVCVSFYAFFQQYFSHIGG
jgi:hypothetical protein